MIAAQSPPPDPAGVPPPPPLLVEDPVDDVVPAAPAASPEPVEFAKPTTPRTPVTRAPVVTHRDPSPLPRPLRGGLATAAGAGLGAGLGASFLFWGTMTPGTPQLVLLLGAAATPALAAFLAGSLFVMLAIERPALDDWGMVAGCTAVGCLALGLIVLGGAGGVGSIGSGCNVPNSCCGSSSAPGASSSSGGGDEAALWATASGGVGAAVGLGLGALAALTMIDATPNASAVPTLAASAGAGMVIGALLGGAVGGAIAGAEDDHSFEREQATRPAPD